MDNVDGMISKNRLLARPRRLCTVSLVCLTAVGAARADQAPAPPQVDSKVLVDSTWTQIAWPDPPIAWTAGCAYDPEGDLLYMYGGTPNGNVGSNTTLLQRYNPDEDAWYQCFARMHMARGWIKGLCSRGKLYALGGYSNSGTSTDSCEAYDIAEDSWYSIASMPFGVGSYGAVVRRDSLIYVVGGLTRDSARKDVQLYDIFRDTWGLATPLPETHWHGDACILGDTIWFASGRTTFSVHDTMMIMGVIDASDPTRITWSYGPRLPCTDREQGPTVAMDGKVYLFGTGSCGNPAWCLKGWAFDPSDLSFTELPDLFDAYRDDEFYLHQEGVARTRTGDLYKLSGGYASWERGGGLVFPYCRIRVCEPTAAPEQANVPAGVGLRCASVARGVLRLEPTGGGRPAGVDLLDATGRTVRRLQLGLNDVSQLAPGVYFVREQPKLKQQAQAVRKVVLTE